ncbi:hypothetical protein [Chitinophaga tropicalis]|uniref:Uncharacterized protein n=1 Tax=Chitinophaga tropicalis TaxID=2683588 RepID=A0A7K1UD33_9BACT|nr:hypothetical protein [Chitinophaga tropicalis]MVT12282.1 hypothetical protein [Chitinophaga tropicalis]
MKYLIYLIGVILLGVSCKRPINDSKNDLMKLVYQNQKSYYNKSLSDKPDYINIINFGSKGRAKLYKKNGIQPVQIKDFIILEGFSSGWGYYRGLLISDDTSYFYSNGTTGKWDFQPIELDSNIEKETGIRKDIIDKVRSWDTMHINDKKKQLGSLVSDGFVFIATKVKFNGSHDTQIETIAFDEFVP